MAQQEDSPIYSNMSPDSKNGLSAPGSRGRNYEIHVIGHLSDAWADWFDGLTMARLDNGEMVLSGTIVDQAALMGVLNKIIRLNLTLVCVQETNCQQ